MKSSTIKWLAGLMIASIVTLGAVAPQAQAATDTQSGPDADTIDSLLHMREEEKLARDVYLTLYNIWGTPRFYNIARSEQQHMDMMLTLLNAYGIADPVGSKGIGEFTDPAFTALYTDLVAQGSVSLEAAYGVGVTIETLDIADLQAAMQTIDEADILAVYGRLLTASENHLRAFSGAAYGQARNGNGQGSNSYENGRGRRGR